MQTHHSAASTHKVRPVKPTYLALAHHRRVILAVILALTVFAGGTIGYRLASPAPISAAMIVNDADSVAAFTDQLTTDNEQAAIIEQVNLKLQLDAQKVKNDELENSINVQQQEMDNLEDTILGALMSNLNTKSISRSSKTYTAYRAEAVNLLSLTRKLNTFKKTDAVNEIDITTYETALSSRLSHLPTIKPIPGSFDGYGSRKHPIFGYYHFHPAADVGAATGTKIKAAAAGTVVKSQYSGGSGNYVTINHGNGFTTTYMHCSKLLVSVGDKVSKGSVIALVGSTGSSTTPHLHYEIKFNGESINPLSMIME